MQNIMVIFIVSFCNISEYLDFILTQQNSQTKVSLKWTLLNFPYLINKW